MARSIPTDILKESLDARRRAEELLKGLLSAKSQTEQYLSDAGREDPVKKLTGRSAIDNAIASTRRMIETLDRAMEQVRQELSEQDLAEIESCTDTRG
ncbi:MAG: hypothetical protein KF787_00295 [Phycisphaeraceae bacterium]|nr:hypothetical protein [Phycisphaerae bacterium]MBX3391063.1 hypothetical protein [Phycisphaeraceae bacterium]